MFIVLGVESEHQLDKRAPLVTGDHPALFYEILRQEGIGRFILALPLRESKKKSTDPTPSHQIITSCHESLLLTKSPLTPRAFFTLRASLKIGPLATIKLPACSLDFHLDYAEILPLDLNQFKPSSAHSDQGTRTWRQRRLKKGPLIYLPTNNPNHTY